MRSTSISDDGQGVPPTEVEHVFFAERQRVHALVLLRRRLQGLFGRSFQLEVRSEIGEGTTVTMRIPLRKRFGVGLESPKAIPSELWRPAPNSDLFSCGSRSELLFVEDEPLAAQYLAELPDDNQVEVVDSGAESNQRPGIDRRGRAASVWPAPGRILFRRFRHQRIHQSAQRAQVLPLCQATKTSQVASLSATGIITTFGILR